VERSQSVCPSYKLQLEECLSAEQVPTPELIQGYVKKVCVGGGLHKCSRSRGFMSVGAQLERREGKEEGREREREVGRSCWRGVVLLDVEMLVFT